MSRKSYFSHSQTQSYFFSFTIDILIYLDYINSTIRLQILVKPAIAGGTKSPLFMHQESLSYDSDLCVNVIIRPATIIPARSAKTYLSGLDIK